MPIQTQDWTGQTISSGRYEIVSRIGQGGMGQVYKARDHHLDTHVVVKIPHAVLLQDEEFLKRFQREIRSLVKLSHPHIVKITDVGEHQGLPFMVMQYLDGGSLESQRPRDEEGVVKNLRPQQLNSFLPQIAQALDYLHDEGFIHRDVKPANILFDRKGNAYLGDFGIIKAAERLPGESQAMTGTGMMLGTPDYMAPELVSDKYDGRVDQYALAVVCYEMLSGDVPFSGPTPVAVMLLHSTQTPAHLRERVPELSEAVAEVVMRGLSKDPRSRYPSCRQFTEALLAAASAQATKPVPVPAKQVADFEGDCPLVPLKELTDVVSSPKQVTSFVSAPKPVTLTTPKTAAVMAGDVETDCDVESFPPVPRQRPRSALKRFTRKWRRRCVQGWDWLREDRLLQAWAGAALLVTCLLAGLFWLLRDSAPETFAGTEAGDLWEDNSLGMKFRWCPPGSFTMGSPTSEKDRDPEREAQVNVTLTKGFWLGQHEITQAEWQAVMSTTPWKGKTSTKEGGNYPAAYVSWNEASEFCVKLTTKGHIEGWLPRDWKVELPTEAQWEYACRAGTETGYSFGDDESQLGQYA